MTRTRSVTITRPGARRSKSTVSPPGRRGGRPSDAPGEAAGHMLAKTLTVTQ